MTNGASGVARPPRIERRLEKLSMRSPVIILDADQFLRERVSGKRNRQLESVTRILREHQLLVLLARLVRHVGGAAGRFEQRFARAQEVFLLALELTRVG